MLKKCNCILYPEQRIELENDREVAKEHLNKMLHQLDITTNDKENLISQLQVATTTVAIAPCDATSFRKVMKWYHFIS